MNDASFRDKKRISVNGYRAKRKENQSEVEKITQHEKEKCRFTKKQNQMLDKNNMEAEELINITNS